MLGLDRTEVLAFVAVLALAAAGRADEFGDCFQRVDRACRQQVLASYGCTSEGGVAGAQPKACQGHPNESIVVRGRVVQCDGICTAPRSALDQCVAAAATHCASLLDRAQGKGQP